MYYNEGSLLLHICIKISLIQFAICDTKPKCPETWRNSVVSDTECILTPEWYVLLMDSMVSQTISSYQWVDI